MRALLTLSSLLCITSIFSQSLEVEGKAKVTEMENSNTADSLVVWLADSTLGIRELSSIQHKLIDTDQDTKIGVEEASDEDIIRFKIRNEQVMMIDSTGNIGIGDTMPQEALSLAGGSFLQTPANPNLTGSLGIGESPFSVYVSGRYAYVVDFTSADLKVIDVSDPTAPNLTGSLGIGPGPRSLYVSGRYAYVVDEISDDLKIIDVSNPGAPSLTGSLGIGSLPISVFVSGRYAYVVDRSSADLKVIDVSDPSAPSLTGSLVIGSLPISVFVSGRYAYVVDFDSNDLKVIDVSDPSAPSLTGSLVVGPSPTSLYVSGRYAYVVDAGSSDLKVIDVSDPGAPTLTGSLGIGSEPRSIYISGGFAYVVVVGSNDLKVIDVSDPGAPTLTGSLGISGTPWSIYVSGRFAYVVDIGSDDLKVIDISGAEVTSMVAHSLEVGNLQVRNDIITQGQLQVSGGINVGSGGIFSDGNIGIAGNLAVEEIGIGTINPGQPLDVHGDVRMGSDSVFDGSSEALVIRSESDNWYVAVQNENSAAATDFFIGKNSSEDGIFHIENDGDIGIGTTTPASKLEVENGDIRVTGGAFIDDGTTLNVPDYVFDQNYSIKSLKQVEAFIQQHHHLEGFPSQYDTQGWAALSLQAREMKLLEKVEELTLYAIEQERMIDDMKDGLIEQDQVIVSMNQKFIALQERLVELEKKYWVGKSIDGFQFFNG